MIDFIDSTADVLALSLSGRIGSDDLDRVMHRVETAMAGDAPLHLFVETRGIDGFELSGLAAYAARALPLLGKLDRFGRVAVVADQGWVRVAARLKSALLPGINYCAFLPDQRDAALAWVEGRSAAPA